MNSNTFVVAPSEMPVSLDPLEADYANNLHASQMVHQTILEVGSDNTLQSGILESFSYEPSTRKIKFTLKHGQRFSDGSSVTVEDLKISILRMVLKRPKFPVLRHIVGVSEWLNYAVPLKENLSGVRVDRDTIEIELSRDVHSPLFRFALPLFGVVKASCVDHLSNKLSKECPTSGYYKAKWNSDRTIDFELSSYARADFTGPRNIKISYLQTALDPTLIRAFEKGNYIVLNQESGVIGFDREFLDQQGFKRLDQPNSRFSFFTVNPANPIFRSRECRRIFADTVRANLVDEESSIQKEASLFTRILPGYRSEAELLSEAPKVDSSNCSAIFAKGRIRMMPNSNGLNRPVELAIERAAKHLGIAFEWVVERSVKERFDGFIDGKFDVLLAGSGFWPFDPVGDVQMLFTPGLHKPLSLVTRDLRLQELLSGLEFLDDPSHRLAQINQYIFDEAMLNVFSHSKRSYFVKGPGISKTIPVAITPPAPWQVFSNVESNQ